MKYETQNYYQNPPQLVYGLTEATLTTTLLMRAEILSILSSFLQTPYSCYIIEEKAGNCD